MATLEDQVQQLIDGQTAVTTALTDISAKLDGLPAAVSAAIVVPVPVVDFTPVLDAIAGVSTAIAAVANQVTPNPDN